jgi:hypothetical protein
VELKFIEAVRDAFSVILVQNGRVSGGLSSLDYYERIHA